MSLELAMFAHECTVIPVWETQLRTYVAPDQISQSTDTLKSCAPG